MYTMAMPLCIAMVTKTLPCDMANGHRQRYKEDDQFSSHDDDVKTCEFTLNHILLEFKTNLNKIHTIEII